MHKRIDIFCLNCHRETVGDILSQDEHQYFVSCHDCLTLGAIDIDYPNAHIYEWEDVKPIKIEKPKKVKKVEKIFKIPLQEDVARNIDLD